MTEALTRHTLWEVLELNFILDRHDDLLAESEGLDKIARLLAYSAGGYRY